MEKEMEDLGMTNHQSMAAVKEELNRRNEQEIADFLLEVMLSESVPDEIRLKSAHLILNKAIGPSIVVAKASDLKVTKKE